MCFVIPSEAFCQNLHMMCSAIPFPDQPGPRLDGLSAGH